MIRAKKQKRSVCVCINCSYEIGVSPDTVKEKTLKGGRIIATYVECPVCGEKILKQLDTKETREKANRGVKLELLKQQGKKLTNSQKKRLNVIEKWLHNTRSQLNKLYWDEIYQSLNEKTEMANQEPESWAIGDQHREVGERMIEHV